MRYLSAEASFESKMRQATHSLDTRQTIQLFGQFCVRQKERTITRFRTKKAAELLAYLAYYRHRQHAREALIELLWPEESLEAGRNRLSVELNSLRRQLEPPGVPAGAILRTDRTHVQLNPDAYTTDVAEFEAALQAAGQEGEDAGRAALLASAIEIYRGELLPGYYGDWALTERERLADAYFNALRQLTGCLARLRQFERALDYARRAIQADPLREASYRDLMRLYMTVGRPLAALELYQDLERLLREALDALPSMATQELAAQIQAQVGTDRASAVKLPLSSLSSPGASSIKSVAPVESAEVLPPIRAGSLPMQFTRFFGRETEIASLVARLSEGDIRLLTLSGPGGSGKTRLSVELGRRLREDFPGGVWFVPLADLFDARLIAEGVRDTLGLPREGNADALEQVVAALASQPALLIFDNFEQVAAGGAPVVRTLLKRVESLKCLVTSRRTLRLPGEQEFPVPPLPVPQGVDSPEQLLHTASVQLFLDRAQAVRPDFQITASNAADVAALCIDLEGLPLAIELAAARAKALTPAQIRERLSERFEILATRRMDKGARHRSLWAAIDWSYHLLPPALQQFFARLSIFRGGWTLEAAEAVCEEPLALDYLAQLQGHSLITAEESTPELHFRMLESLREYAEEQLEDPERLAVARRHGDYFLGLAEQAAAQLLGPEQQRWLARLEREQDNLRAVLTRYQQDPDPHSADRALRLAGSLWRFWWLRGHLSEGRERLMSLLQKPGMQAPTPEMATALGAAGHLAHCQGDYAPAIALFEKALGMQRALGDRSGEAGMLFHLGDVAANQGYYPEARSLLEAARALYEELGERHGQAECLGRLGYIAREQADFSTARSLQEAALAIHQGLGDRMNEAWNLGSLGYVYEGQGDLERAGEAFAQVLDIYRAFGNRSGEAWSLASLGHILCEQGDYRGALPLLEAALAINRDLRDTAGEAWNLDLLGRAYRGLGEYDAARSSLEQALLLVRRIGSRNKEAGILRHLGDVAREQGDVATAHRTYVEALALMRESGWKSGMLEVLEAYSELSLRAGKPERALRIYQAAESLRQKLDLPLSPRKQDWLGRLQSDIRALMSPSSWADAEKEEWTLEAALDYALKIGSL